MELVAMALILTAVLVGQYFLYKRLGLKDLSYTLTIRRRSDGKSSDGIVEAFEGEELEFIEEIDNAKLLPLPWVRSEISCSRWLSFYGGEVTSKDSAQKGLISGIFTLRGRQKCRRTWRVRCEKRGIFTVEDISLTVSDLFGLVRSARVIKLNQQVRVLPVPADIEAGGMSSDVFIGDIPVRRFVLPDPFVISGAREYTGREPMNRIHWAQSARTGSLMVYNNEFTTERRVIILLNVQRNFHGERQEISIPTLEALIKGAAFMLDWCMKTHTQCALTVNSPEPVQPECGEGYGHTIKLLRQLAALETGCGAHIDDFISEVRFDGFTDVVFISGFLDEKCYDTLRALSENGRSVSIFSTDIEETDICDVWHIPRPHIR